MVLNGHPLSREEHGSSGCLGCGVSEDKFWADPSTGERVCSVCGLVQGRRLNDPEVYVTDLTPAEEDP